MRELTKAQKRLHYAAILVAACFPGFITWLYFVAFPGKTTTTIFYGLNKVVQILLPVLWMRAVFGRSIRPGRPALRGLAAGAGFGLAVAAGIVALYLVFFRNGQYLEGVPVAIFDKLGELGAATPLRFAAFGLFLILANSAIEEYYWRWFIFGALRHTAPLGIAVAVSGVTFMFHHVVVLGSFLSAEYFWTMVLFFSVCIGSGGAVWAYLYHRTGSIFVPWLSHLLADVAVMAIGFDMLRGYWQF